MGWARECKSTKNDANDANKIAANRNQQNLGGRKNMVDIFGVSLLYGTVRKSFSTATRKF